MNLEEALLEDWMRDHYFTAAVDIGSSGVHPFTFGELRELTGLAAAELDAVTLRDSWTLGGDGVRRAVADRFAEGRVDRVMVTHGSSEAIFLTMSGLLAAGDEVVVLDPAYHQLAGIAAAIGCEVRRWRLRPDDGFRPDLDRLRALVTPRTRMVVVNFPHNPTGVTLTPGEQRELVAVAAAAGAYLVWDAAFAELTHDRPPLPDPAGWYPRTITYGTLSKAYGLPGLRIGWCLAGPEVLARCVRWRDYVSLGLSPLVELVAERVLRHGDALLARRRDLVAANLRVVSGWIADRPDDVRWTPPAGGVSAFVRFPGVDDTGPLCRALAEEHGVLLVPGACFGHPAHARLGFGAPTAELTAGLDRLAGHLHRHRDAA